MIQIVRTVGPKETKYIDISEDARSVGMTKVGWVRKGQQDTYLATRHWAGQDVTDTYATRNLAEQWIESTLDDGDLIATIAVN